MSEPTAKKPSLVLGALKYVIGLVLLVAVVWMNWNGKPDGTPGLVDLFDRTPDWSMLGLVSICFVGVISSQYVRWFVLVRALGLNFTLRNAIRLGMVGTFYNLFLPGAIGGDIVKAIFIARDQPTRRAAAVSTVIADRLLGLFGLLVFGGFVSGALWLAGNERIASNPKLQTIVIACAAASTCGALGYLALGLISKDRSDRIAAKLATWPKGTTLAELWTTGWTYRQQPLAIIMGIGLSAVGHLLMMLAFHFSVQIFPPDDRELLGTFTEHCVIGPIGYIVQAVIPLPAGIGASEFTFGGLYELIRPGGKVVGLTGRLSTRIVELLVGAACYIVYLTARKELPKDEPAAA